MRPKFHPESESDLAIHRRLQEAGIELDKWRQKEKRLLAERLEAIHEAQDSGWPNAAIGGALGISGRAVAKVSPRTREGA